MQGLPSKGMALDSGDHLSEQKNAKGQGDEDPSHLDTASMLSTGSQSLSKFSHQQLVGDLNPSEKYESQLG